MQRTRCETVATAIDEAGLGVGVERGVGEPRELHVIDLLPGERAEVVVDHASPHKAIAWAHVVKRLDAPSEDRVAPLCPAFGRCGGCTWQHLSYPAQLVEKRHRVTAALSEVPAVRAGTVDIAAVHPSPSITGYRNKGKYVAGRSGEHVILGAYAPRSHHVIDTLGCRVVAPVIDEVATWVRGAAEAANLIPYSEKERLGELRYVIVRESAGDVLVALVVAPRTPWSKLEQVALAISKHPAVRGLVAVENDRTDGAIIPSGSLPQVVWGDGALVEHLAGIAVEVGAGEFLQVNRAQASAMYTRVVELAELRPPPGQTSPPPGQTSPPPGQTSPPPGQTNPPPGRASPPSGQASPPSGQASPPSGQTNPPLGQASPPSGQTNPRPGPSPVSGRVVAPTGSKPTRVVDLYSGLGGIALHFAKAGAAVTAVEIDRDAVAALRRAAETAKLPLTAIAADAGDHSRSLREACAGADVIVVNPPRKGLSAGTRALLVEAAPSIIIYVSCGPEALGRDLVALAAHGYHPDAIEPFDLMPGTAQIETVVRLRRAT